VAARVTPAVRFTSTFGTDLPLRLRLGGFAALLLCDGKSIKVVAIKAETIAAIAKTRYFAPLIFILNLPF
jgi:hypothetical protein